MILLGDLNDEPQAATTQIVLGPPGSEVGTGGFNRPDQGDAWRLWNVAPLLPAEEQYSCIYRGRSELIDHIFVSHALIDRIESVRSIGGERLPSVDDDPNDRRNEPVSGHAFVLAEFEV